jgi:hypothetical protein
MPTQIDLVLGAKNLFNNNDTELIKRKQEAFFTIAAELLIFPQEHFIKYLNNPFKPKNWNEQLALTAITTIALDDLGKLFSTPPIDRLKINAATLNLLHNIKYYKILKDNHSNFLEGLITILSNTKFLTRQIDFILDYISKILSKPYFPETAFIAIKKRLWHLIHNKPPELPKHNLKNWLFIRDKATILLGRLYLYLNKKERKIILKILKGCLKYKYLSENTRTEMKRIVELNNLKRQL